ncbi:hypothetical protein BGZ76_009960 [Entomortierella beljakovae]|nr:hypothetical protein BGZ76_009960 [Entomortierella beljakovae]
MPPKKRRAGRDPNDWTTPYKGKDFVSRLFETARVTPHFTPDQLGVLIQFMESQTPLSIQINRITTRQQLFEKMAEYFTTRLNESLDLKRSFDLTRVNAAFMETKWNKIIRHHHRYKKCTSGPPWEPESDDSDDDAGGFELGWVINETNSRQLDRVIANSPWYNPNWHALETLSPDGKPRTNDIIAVGTQPTNQSGPMQTSSSSSTAQGTTPIVAPKKIVKENSEAKKMIQKEDEEAKERIRKEEEEAKVRIRKEEEEAKVRIRKEEEEAKVRIRKEEMEAKERIQKEAMEAVERIRNAEAELMDRIRKEEMEVRKRATEATTA